MILLYHREEAPVIYLQPPSPCDPTGTERMWCADKHVFADDETFGYGWLPARYVLAVPALTVLDDPFADPPEEDDD